MNKERIRIADAAKPLIEALPKGVLLTTKAGDKANTMVIGWGTIGINWGKPVFAAYVRLSRYTRTMLDANPEFTVNIPLGERSEKVKEAIRVCGKESGRNMDKFTVCGLTAVEPEEVSAPAIAEFPLTLECRVIYRQQQEAQELPPEIIERLYPANEEGRRDAHVTYFGEIVDAYVLS